jgi:hypothetical protein
MSKSRHAYLVPAFILATFVLFLFTNCDGVKFDKGAVAKTPAQTSTPTPLPSPSAPTPSPSPSTPAPSPNPSSPSPTPSPNAPNCTDTSTRGPKASGELCACDCECAECAYMSDDCNECPTANDVVYSQCSNTNNGRSFRHCK